jgi:hypothetical protein
MCNAAEFGRQYKTQEATCNIGTDEDEMGLWIFILTYPVVRVWD